MLDNISFDSFLLYATGRLVTEEYVAKEYEDVLSFMEKVKGGMNDVNNFSLIDRMVCNIKEKVDEGKSLCVMAGGGVDSNFLIILSRLIFSEKKIFVVCGRTKSNENDLKSTYLICEKFNVDFYSYRINKEDKEAAIYDFVRCQGRYPNDVVMPLMCSLIKKAYEVDCDCQIMDGQFADTVLFSNPQNLAFDFVKGIEVKQSLLRSFLMFAGNNLMNDKINVILRLMTLGIADKIIYLTRLQGTERVANMINFMIGKYSPELVLQSVFYKILINYRERDKYVLNGEVISPFDDNDIFVYSYLNLRRRNVFKPKKKVLKDFIKCHCPESVSMMRSRSFEPE